MPPLGPRRALSLLALPALAACDAASVATQILVVVDSDLTPGAELTQVDVALYDRDGRGDPLATRSFRMRSGAARPLTYEIPLSFALVPPSARSSRDFRLVVAGLGLREGAVEESTVASQQVIAAFVPHASLRLGVFLSRDCYGNLCDDAVRGALTCIRGQCDDVPVLTSLPTADGTPLGGYTPPVVNLLGEPDGGVGGPSPDADVSPADASVAVDASGVGELDGGNDGGNDAGAPDAQIYDAALPDGGRCPDGFYATADASCADIDECAARPADCDVAYPCEQTSPAGYACRGLLADWEMPASVNGGQTGFALTFAPDRASVIDGFTRLEWESVPATTDLPYAAAVSFCEGLTLGTRSDFRMPTLLELVSIMDETRLATGVVGRAIDTNFFAPSSAASATSVFWTASPGTPANGGPMGARRVVDFGSATLPAPYPETAALPVRCVRRNEPLYPGTPAERFVADVPGTVRDQRTGLLWRTETLATTYTWEAAVKACAQLPGGTTSRPYRLPGYKELLTLIDPRTPSANPVFNAALGSPADSTYWTSSSLGTDTSQAYFVDFADATGSTASKNQSFYVRCVRSSVE